MISVEERNGIRVIALNRPERRNAMTPDLMQALVHALGVRAAPIQSAGLGPVTTRIVLTAAPPAFCVGADLKWLGELDDPGEGVGALVAAHHDAVRALLAAPTPVIAAVNGAAAGGGLSLALAADYRVVSSKATFTAAYFGVGLSPDGGNSAFLVRAIGSARAMELLLTNRVLTAQEALAWGLVNEVVAPETVLERACALAASLPPVSSETLRVTRRLLDSASSEPLIAQLDAEELAMRAAARSPEFSSALKSFLRR